jgi:hypothetical protein
MPVLVIAVASNVTPVVLAESGHWLIDERPRETVDALSRFLQAPALSAGP